MKFSKIILLLAISFILTECKVEDSATEPEPGSPFFYKIAEYQTEVLEPSGLTLDKNHNYLWTVSDNTNQVYKLNTKGNIIKTLDFIGDDLEGISYDHSDNTLWVAEEQLRELVHIDTNGNEIARFQITNLEGSGNSGIEGVCVDSSKSFFVLNEKKPRLWAKLNSNFVATTIKEITELGDLSGIFCFYNGNFLIVSDESKKLFEWSPTAGIIASIDLGYSKAEGIAYDKTTGKAYIVSDATGKLYVYK